MRTHPLPKELIHSQHGPHLTILIPTHRYGKEVLEGQDQLMLKNNLKQAREELRAWNLSEEEVKQFLLPAQNMLNNPRIWSHMLDGLAIFLSKDLMFFAQLPVHFPNLVYLSDHFYVKELAPFYQKESSFYLLSLSLKKNSLYEVTRYSIIPVNTRGFLPKEVDTFADEELEKILQFHSIGKHETPFYHGHGGSTDHRETLQGKYLKEINDGLMRFLKDDSIPLVLACVEDTFAAYQQVNSHPNLYPKCISGNHERTDLDKLHHQALQVVAPYLKREEYGYLATFQEAIHTKWTSSDIETLIPAAYDGRIQTLFTQFGSNIWGTYQSEQRKVKIQRKKEIHNSCLLNEAVRATLINGGEVFNLPQEQLPGVKGSPIAAILRY